MMDLCRQYWVKRSFNQCPSRRSRKLAIRHECQDDQAQKAKTCKICPGSLRPRCRRALISQNALKSFTKAPGPEIGLDLRQRAAEYMCQQGPNILGRLCSASRQQSDILVSVMVKAMEGRNGYNT